MTPHADHPNTLYAQWQTLAAGRGEAWAVWDFAGDRTLSFAELAQAADNAPRPEALVLGMPLVAIPAHGVDFLVDVLAAWKAGLAVLPLEPGQTPPEAWLVAGAELPPLPVDCALVKLTSGSTGTPRGVAFTSAQVAADAAQLVPAMGMNADLPNLGVISLAHSYGFSNLVTPLLLHGIPLGLAGSALPDGLRRVFAATPPTPGTQWLLPGVPALWHAWLKSGIFSEGAGHPVRRGISAGAPLPLELEQQALEAAGLRIHNFYGASECGGIAYDPGAEPRADAALAGEVIPGVQAHVSSAGVLEVRGPAVGHGYWPEPGAQLQGGVYTSSDLVELRGHGLYMLGRAGDLIHIAGRKLMPDEVEAVLRTHPQVAECLVFGIHSRVATRQEEIVACVRAQPTANSPEAQTALELELRNYLHDRLPGWKLPRHWWITAELKANARGKLPRDTWRQRFLHAFPAQTA